MIEDEIIREVFDICIKENNIDMDLFTFNREELEDLIRFVISQT